LVAVGVDGCKAGWFAVRIADSEPPMLDVFGCIDLLWQGWSSQADLTLVDIPIGLADSAPSRPCDQEARRLLGAPRASSVFNPPVRACLVAESWREAAELNAAACGRRISQQTWGIIPKIREVDSFVRADPGRQSRLREVHPEVLFYFLNGRRPARNKKSRTSGVLERLVLLDQVLPQATTLAEAAFAKWPRKHVARDDVLDAMVGAVVAHLCGTRLETLPSAPGNDREGLTMEMVVPPSNSSAF